MNTSNENNNTEETNSTDIQRTDVEENNVSPQWTRNQNDLVRLYFNMGESKCASYLKILMF